MIKKTVMIFMLTMCSFVSAFDEVDDVVDIMQECMKDIRKAQRKLYIKQEVQKLQPKLTEQALNVQENFKTLAHKIPVKIALTYEELVKNFDAYEHMSDLNERYVLDKKALLAEAEYQITVYNELSDKKMLIVKAVGLSVGLAGSCVVACVPWFLPMNSSSCDPKVYKSLISLCGILGSSVSAFFLNGIGSDLHNKQEMNVYKKRHEAVRAWLLVLSKEDDEKNHMYGSIK